MLLSIVFNVFILFVKGLCPKVNVIVWDTVPMWVYSEFSAALRGPLTLLFCLDSNTLSTRMQDNTKACKHCTKSDCSCSPVTDSTVRTSSKSNYIAYFSHLNTLLYCMSNRENSLYGLFAECAPVFVECLPTFAECSPVMTHGQGKGKSYAACN